MVLADANVTLDINPITMAELAFCYRNEESAAFSKWALRLGPSWSRVPDLLLAARSASE